MSCCRCIKRLEHVEKVIGTYDPNETFLSYDLLTVWVNKKTKKAFILVSKENGIATWVPINADITTIDKIILNCGEVEANENNEIVHTGQCGARTVTDDCTDLCITIETEWGLKGGGIVCAGEKLTLGIDLTNTNLVISSVKDVQDGDLVAFDGTSGKVIKKADNLRLGDAENSWNGKINPTTKALEFYPNDLSTTPILSLLPNGVIIGNNQPKASARLTQSTPVFQKNQWLQLGSNLAFQKLRDEDGYNTSANNFFPGDGNGKGAFYTFKYKGVWCIQFQFLIDQSINKTGTRIVYRLTWGKEGSYQSLRNAYQLAWKYQAISDCRLLPVEKDDICFLEVSVEDTDESIKPFIYAESDNRSIDSYIGFFLTIG